jgi:hypothetical protein
MNSIINPDFTARLPTIPPIWNKNRVKNKPINWLKFNTPGQGATTRDFAPTVYLL